MKLKDVLKVVTCDVEIYGEDLEILACCQDYKIVFPYLENEVIEIARRSVNESLYVVLAKGSDNEK